MAKKKNGEIRLCVDYRALNAKTNRPIFPIPSSEEIFDSIGGSKYFSTLDLSSGYHQVPVAEEDIPKTAFSTRHGQYEFVRMPFGLCGAPATFQRLMNLILRKENWINCVIYLDDILIFGKTIEEHNHRLEMVLSRIKQAGLKLAPTKCKFMETEIKYLGHIINEEGVKTDPDKISSIKEWKIPGCKKELQTFLGFCNYYRRFIKDYATMSSPLSSMLKNDSKFMWTEESKSMFYKLKEQLTQPPVLALPVKGGKYILDTDASHDTIGAVLSQVQNGEERVIYYASKTLTKSQKQYCITRKELLAIHTFVLKFKHYLIGSHFLVRTDHQALKWLLNWNSPNTSQYCIWKSELEIFDMEIEFRKGKEHNNADALSRPAPCEQCAISHQDPKRKRNVKEFHSVHNKSDKTCSEYSEKIVNEIQEHGDSSYNEWEQEKDEELRKLLNLKNNKDEMRRYHSNGYEVRIRGDIIYLFKDGIYRVMVPKHKRMEIIWNHHKKLGHPGLEKTIEAISRKHYWPKMANDIKETLSKCTPCIRNKDINGRIRAPLQSSVTKKPFEVIGIDITGPFISTRKGYRYILGVIDYFSKYICLIPMKTITAEEVIKKLWIHWISKFGIPERIHSDRGTNFTSNLFVEHCRALGIEKTHTSPYYPQSNGLTERLFKTIKPMISAVMEERNILDWSEVLPFVELGIRTTKQKTTKYSPYEVLFGHRPRIDFNYPESFTDTEYHSTEEYVNEMKRKIKIIHENIEQNAREQNEKDKERYDKNRWSTRLKIGQMVMIKNQGAHGFESKYIGPFIIKRIINDWTFILYHEGTNKEIQRNYNQIKELNKGKVQSEKTKTQTSIRTWKWKKSDPIQSNERRYPTRSTRNPTPVYK